MTVPLAVFFTERAPVARAQWLQRLLEPLAAACNMQPPPLEIRPTGCAGGWASSAKLAPDRRVCISSKIVFYHEESIKYVYLHESVHRIFESREIDHHGPEFFCLLAILLAKSSTFFAASSWDKLDLYDLQDRPEALNDDEGWRGTVLNWSLKTAAELADSDAAAEAMADVVCARWQSFLVERKVEQAAAAKTATASITQRKKLTEQVVELKNSRTLWMCLSALGWSMSLVLVWLIIRGFN